MPCRTLLPLAIACALASLGCEAFGDDGRAAPRCDANSDCLLVPTDCCGLCGMPTADQVTAILASERQAHNEMICGGPVGCDPRDCPVAPPAFVASCQEGRCVAVELRGHPATACETLDDCVARTVECCGCGGSTRMGDVVSVSDERAYQELVCDPRSGCNLCVGGAPPQVVSRCEEGSCTVLDLRESF